MMSDYIETVQEQRRSLRDAFRDNAAAKDKIVISVAGAALALSVSVLRDLTDRTQWVWLLVMAWISFAVSLIAVVVSLFLNASQIKRSVDRIDVWLNDRPAEGGPLDGAYIVTFRNRPIRLVDAIEAVSIFALVLGVISVVLFVSLTI